MSDLYQPSQTNQPDVDMKVFREIQMMQASGWRVERHWTGGADFISQSQPAISTGVNLILCVLTLGLWIPVFIAMEMFRPGPKRCRLTVDEAGQPQYTETGSSKHAKKK